MSLNIGSGQNNSTRTNIAPANIAPAIIEQIGNTNNGITRTRTNIAPAVAIGNTNNGITSTRKADEFISSIQDLTNNISTKTAEINGMLPTITEFNNTKFINNEIVNSVLKNGVTVTKENLAAFFGALLSKKTEINTKIGELEEYNVEVNSFESKRAFLEEELKLSAANINKKIRVINAKTVVNHANTPVYDELVTKSRAMKDKIDDVIRLRRPIQILKSSSNTGLEEIKKKLNAIFFKIRCDFRNKLVAHYAPLITAKLTNFNTKYGTYKESMLNNNKIGLVKELKEQINVMLKYVTFCKEQLAINKLGNINISNSNSNISVENRALNKKTGLLEKITSLEDKLTEYRNKLDILKGLIKSDFEKELKDLTDKIALATTELKKCIEAYKVALLFSPENDVKVSKHKLNKYKENATQMIANVTAMNLAINSIRDKQTTIGQAKLTELLRNVDFALGIVSDASPASTTDAVDQLSTAIASITPTSTPEDIGIARDAAASVTVAAQGAVQNVEQIRSLLPNPTSEQAVAITNVQNAAGAFHAASTIATESIERLQNASESHTSNPNGNTSATLSTAITDATQATTRLNEAQTAFSQSESTAQKAGIPIVTHTRSSAEIRSALTAAESAAKTAKRKYEAARGSAPKREAARQAEERVTILKAELAVATAAEGVTPSKPEWSNAQARNSHGRTTIQNRTAATTPPITSPSGNTTRRRTTASTT